MPGELHGIPPRLLNATPLRYARVTGRVQEAEVLVVRVEVDIGQIPPQIRVRRHRTEVDGDLARVERERRSLQSDALKISGSA